MNNTADSTMATVKPYIASIRILLGFMFFYAGFTKVFDPSWSAEFYLRGAKTFSGLYAFFLQPDILPFINFINKWGLLFIGISLILGLYSRYFSLLGAFFMIMYYLPTLDFPYAGLHSYLVDQHIIYIAVLLFLAKIDADKYFGLGK